MSGIVEFNEASQLYAENYQVVEAMRAAFDAEVNGFYDHVRELIRQRAMPLPLHEKTTQGFRYWWLGGDERTADRQPRLWFDVRKVDVVVPGKWEIVVGAPEAGPEEIARVRALSLEEQLRSFCVLGGGDSWTLFTATLETAGADPSHLADRLATILRALHDTHKDFAA